ncbi:hypothetical protein [Sulfuricurvum sp.]|uniref:hypothetical protein n=1 Tax=Sulfuricurvum sp. TaxID=2025608 RepID=UPI0026344550|nr:hypothetical protein [Sulfuricurvum sp.]MDD3596139.1 hypothetical protein [Sulfuricurvum sp.]
MLKAFVLIALVYLFVRTLLDYKASLSTTKMSTKSKRGFMSHRRSFIQRSNSFGFHRRYRGMKTNPATGLAMKGNVDVCGNPYGFKL